MTLSQCERNRILIFACLLLSRSIGSTTLQREAVLVITRQERYAWVPKHLLFALCAAASSALTYSMQQGDWLGNAWQSTVIIDAGSTGSRIHIYQYKVSRAGLAVVRQPVSSLKVTPGLSAYAVQPENVGQSLGSLLEYAYKQVC